jgi:hypothetical protein
VGEIKKAGEKTPALKSCRFKWLPGFFYEEHAGNEIVPGKKAGETVVDGLSPGCAFFEEPEGGFQAEHSRRLVSLIISDEKCNSPAHSNITPGCPGVNRGFVKSL